MDDHLRPSLVAVAVALAVLVAVPALAGVGPAPSKGTLSWSYTPAIAPRTWLSTSACSVWDNTSGSVCTSWNNITSWACMSERTYLYTPGSLSSSVLAKDSMGFASNVSVSGTWNIADAGNKALAGRDAFNANYCLNGANVTDADVADLQAEMNAINLTVLRGKNLKPVPAPVGSALSLTGETEATRAGRVAEMKAGNHSVTLTYTTTSDFDGGTKDGVSAAANSLSLATVPGSGYSTAFMSGFNSSVYTITPNTALDGQDGWTATAGTLVVGAFGGEAQEGDGAMGSDGIGDAYANHSVQQAITTRTTAWFYMVGSGSGSSKLFLMEGTTTLLWVGNDNENIYYSSGCTNTAWVPSDSVHAGFEIFTYSNNTYDLRWANNQTRIANAQSLCNNMVSGVNNITVQQAYRTSPENIRFDNITYATQATPYTRSGAWASTVMDAGTQYARWINWTNTSTMAASTGMNWSMRSSNTSFAQNDTTPAWTPLGNASSGVNALTNISRYAQFNASLWSSSDTATPALDAFVAQYTPLAYNTNAFTGNVTYAAPGQPVRVGVTYTDPDPAGSSGGEASLWLNNSTPDGAAFCQNNTRATGNSTAYCVFLWNHTTDNSAPSFCGLLTDYDAAGNWTNCTAPITTDNAVPTVTTDAIANTSSGSFSLAIYRADVASGMNRTWFSIYNLSNNSAGDTPLTNYSNTTLWNNDTISLCHGVVGGQNACMGQIRVAASGDDAVGTASGDGYRHWSGYSNVSFWFDPLPVLTNASVTGCGSFGGGCTVWGNVVENLTTTDTVTARIRSPSGAYVEKTMAIYSGDRDDGVWTVGFVLATEFPGEDTGTYEVQVAARDESTTDYATAANLTLSYGVAGGGAGTGPGGAATGGGPAPISIFASPSPGAPGVAAVPTQGLACPPEVRQVHYITPYDRGTSRWGLTCRTLSGFAATGCSIVGEKVAPNGTLTGEADPWWSCQAVGEDRVQITYTIPQAQISDEMFLRFIPTKQLAWNTLARVRAESGQNVTALDVRLRVSNFWAAPLRVPIPFPLSSAVSALAPMAPATLLLAAAMAFGAWYRKMGNLAWFWYVGAGILAVFGLGSVVGGVLQGILLGWVLYSGVAVAVWGLARLDAVQKARELKAHLAKG